MARKKLFATMSMDDPEWSIAWQKLKDRYSCNGIEKNEGFSWGYVETEWFTAHNCYYHRFQHINHPKFGPINDIVLASDDWQPEPDTLPMSYRVC